MVRSGRGRTRRPKPQIAELMLTLQDTEPPVWRRIAVPYDIPLAVLHRVLIVAMGWKGYHLHAFEVDDVTYGVPDDELPDSTISEEGATLRTIASGEGAIFTYQYDFGDNWQHLVSLERLVPFTREALVPHCLDGARACPPEDVGGAGGYAEMLQALAGEQRFLPPDSDEEESEDMGDLTTPASYRRWLGFDFDADEFHPHCINMEFSRLLAFDEQFQLLLGDF